MTSGHHEQNETDAQTTDTPTVFDSTTALTSRQRRGARRRDWVVVAAVAAVVLVLGGYLLIRPAETPAPEAAIGGSAPTSSATSSSVTTSSVTTGSTSVSATSPSRPAAVVPPTSADPSKPASESTTAPVEGSKAPKIGPLGDHARREADDPMAQGAVDAPVVMVMFSDYRCPFCAQFSRTTEKELVDRYVKTGVLRIEWRDMPIFGEQSTAAAVAGRAAAAQDKFFEFTQAVYVDAPQTGHPDLTTEALIGYAKEAGIPDIDTFAAAIDDPAAAKAVAADLEESGAIGVPSTPAFIINGYPLLGAQPLSEFTSLIDTVQTLK